MNITKEYLAGFWDGEGTIGFWVNSNTRLQPFVSVEHTCRDLLAVIACEYGGNLYRRKVRSEKHRTSWIWRISGQMAVRLVRDLAPHLQVKRAQADLVLVWAREAQGRPSTSVVGFEDFKTVMHALNARGPRSGDAPTMPLTPPQMVLM